MADESEETVSMQAKRMLYDVTFLAQWDVDSAGHEPSPGEELVQMGFLRALAHRLLHPFSSSQDQILALSYYLSRLSTSIKVAASPNATTIAIVQNRGLCLLSAASGFSPSHQRIVRLPALGDPKGVKCAWSTDSELVAVANSVGLVTLVDQQGRKLLDFHPHHVCSTFNPGPIFALDFRLSIQPTSGVQRQELLVLNGEGQLLRLHVPIRYDDDGQYSTKVGRPKLAHDTAKESLIDTSEWHTGVSAMCLDRERGILAVAGGIVSPSKAERLRNASGISFWRLTDEAPYYELLNFTTAGREPDQELSALKSTAPSNHNYAASQGSWGKTLLGAPLPPHPGTLMRIDLSPNGKLLATLDFSGGLTVQTVEGSVVQKWVHISETEKQEGGDSCVGTIMWWSNELLLVAFASGRLSVVSFPGLDNHLGESPPEFGGSLSIERGPPGRMFVLDEKEMSKLSQDHTGSLSCKLFLLNECTPSQYLQMKIENEEFDVALKHAQKYALDPDIVYISQWFKHQNREDAVDLYLTKVSNLKWLLMEGSQKLLESPGLTVNLYDLILTRTNYLLENILGNETKKGGEHDVTLSVEQLELVALRLRIERYRERLIVFEKIVAAESEAFAVPIFGKGDAECGRSDNPVNPMLWSKQSFALFRDADLGSTAMSLAKEGRIPALIALFETDRGQVLQRRLEVLSVIPETISPSLYKGILPAIGPEGSGLAWTYKDGKIVNQGHLLTSAELGKWQRLLKYRGVLGDELFDNFDAVNHAQISTSGAICQWYCDRAQTLEGVAGQLDYAHDLLRLGIERMGGFEAAQETATSEISSAIKEPYLEMLKLYQDMSQLFHLIYNVGVDDRLSLAEWRQMTKEEKVAILLIGASPETVVRLIRQRIYPLMADDEPEAATAWLLALSEYLKRLTLASSEGIRVATAVIEASKPTDPPDKRIIVDLLELSVSCCYGCPSGKELDYLFRIFECLPVRDEEEERRNPRLCQLQVQVDEMHGHLNALEVMMKYGVSPPLSFFREATEIAAQTNGDEHLYKGRGSALQTNGGAGPKTGWETLQLICLSASRSRPQTREKWQEVLEDVCSIRENAFIWIPESELFKLVVEAMIHAEAFEVVKAIMDDQNSLLSAAEMEEVILRAAREEFNGSNGTADLERASKILSLVSYSTPDIAAERNLIEAVRLLEELRVEMLPLELRLQSDKMMVIDRALKQSPKECSKRKVIGGLPSPPGLKTLRLAALLGLSSQPVLQQIKVKIAVAAHAVGDYDAAGELCISLLSLPSSSLESSLLHAISSLSQALVGESRYTRLSDKKRLCALALSRLSAHDGAEEGSKEVNIFLNAWDALDCITSASAVVQQENEGEEEMECDQRLLDILSNKIGEVQSEEESVRLLEAAIRLRRHMQRAEDIESCLPGARIDDEGEQTCLESQRDQEKEEIDTRLTQLSALHLRPNSPAFSPSLSVCYLLAVGEVSRASRVFNELCGPLFEERAARQLGGAEVAAHCALQYFGLEALYNAEIARDPSARPIANRLALYSLSRAEISDLLTKTPPPVENIDAEDKDSKEYERARVAAMHSRAFWSEALRFAEVLQGTKKSQEIQALAEDIDLTRFGSDPTYTREVLIRFTESGDVGRIRSARELAAEYGADEWEIVLIGLEHHLLREDHKRLPPSSTELQQAYDEAGLMTCLISKPVELVNFLEDRIFDAIDGTQLGPLAFVCHLTIEAAKKQLEGGAPSRSRLILDAESGRHLKKHRKALEVLQAVEFLPTSPISGDGTTSAHLDYKQLTGCLTFQELKRGPSLNLKELRAMAAGQLVKVLSATNVRKFVALAKNDVFYGFAASDLVRLLIENIIRKELFAVSPGGLQIEQEMGRVREVPTEGGRSTDGQLAWDIYGRFSPFLDKLSAKDLTELILRFCFENEEEENHAGIEQVAVVNLYRIQCPVQLKLKMVEDAIAHLDQPTKRDIAEVNSDLQRLRRARSFLFLLSFVEKMSALKLLDEHYVGLFDVSRKDKRQLRALAVTICGTVVPCSLPLQVCALLQDAIEEDDRMELDKNEVFAEALRLLLRSLNNAQERADELTLKIPNEQMQDYLHSLAQGDLPTYHQELDELPLETMLAFLTRAVRAAVRPVELSQEDEYRSAFREDLVTFESLKSEIGEEVMESLPQMTAIVAPVLISYVNEETTPSSCRSLVLALLREHKLADDVQVKLLQMTKTIVIVEQHWKRKFALDDLEQFDVKIFPALLEASKSQEQFRTLSKLVKEWERGRGVIRRPFDEQLSTIVSQVVFLQVPSKTSVSSDTLRERIEEEEGASKSHLWLELLHTLVDKDYKDLLVSIYADFAHSGLDKQETLELLELVRGKGWHVVAAVMGLLSMYNDLHSLAIEQVLSATRGGGETAEEYLANEHLLSLIAARRPLASYYSSDIFPRLARLGLAQTRQLIISHLQEDSAAHKLIFSSTVHYLVCCLCLMREYAQAAELVCGFLRVHPALSDYSGGQLYLKRFLQGLVIAYSAREKSRDQEEKANNNSMVQCLGWKSGSELCSAAWEQYEMDFKLNAVG